MWYLGASKAENRYKIEKQAIVVILFRAAAIRKFYSTILFVKIVDFNLLAWKWRIWQMRIQKNIIRPFSQAPWYIKPI